MRPPAIAQIRLSAFAMLVCGLAGAAPSAAIGNGGGEKKPGTACTRAFTPIPAIQGSGERAAVSGTVTTRGVVVGDYEQPSGSGQLRGFYLQDPTGDGDPRTADGIFVYNAGKDSVALGDLVEVTGRAGEFHGQTQVSATTVRICGRGTVAPVDVVLPFPDAGYPERYEGMLVRLPQTLYVTEHYQLGRFGQVAMSANARLPQPTSVAAPGDQALARRAANALNRIIIDDHTNLQNPAPILFGRQGQPLSAANTLRGGDRASGIVGVMTYGWAGNGASGNAWRVRPQNALGGGVPRFEAANPRPPAPKQVGGKLRVASFNLHNYFNTFGGCRFGVGGAAADCRGAGSAAELERQAAKTVAALLALDADAIGLMELENDGYGPDSAVADLVRRLNAAAGGPRYAFIDADAATGATNALGTDAIKVGLIYNATTLTPRGTAVLRSGAFGTFVTVGDGRIGRNRPALAQTFRHAGGGTFTLAVNHLKSKASSCEDNVAPVGFDPDAGDGQGNCNLTRTAAAKELAAWLATDPTGSGDPDVLIVGDLNAYAKEDPITALRNAGYTDLVAKGVGEHAYSYVFDGQWGYLDHALASPSLARQVAGVSVWHVNADEPGVLGYDTRFKSTGQIRGLYAADAFRSSDHDPVLVGLDLDGVPP